jgi:uncharacterized protein DUF4325
MILQRVELNVAKEFARIPGPRKRAEGEFSGEEFLETQLRPRFIEAQQSGATLHVNLDGTVGYGTSFLEEAFGGLAREFGVREVEQHLEVTCTDEPYLQDQIWKYIRNANKIR